MKKSNKILMILGIITCLTIIGTCIYLVYNVATNEKNDITESNKNNDVNEQVKETNTDTKEQELEVTEEDINKVKKLIDVIDGSLGSLLYTHKDFIYKNGIITIKELSNWAILYAGFYLYATEVDPMNKIADSNQTIDVSADEIREYIIRIFGKNVQYIDNDTGISCETQNAAYVKFDNKVNNYILTKKGCGGVSFVSKSIPYKIYSIEKYNDRIETTIKTMYVTYEPECIIDNENTRCYVLYDNQDDLNFIGKYRYNDTTDINNILETTSIFTSYKWTFKKDGTNYYFEKIERVN